MKRTYNIGELRFLVKRYESALKKISKSTIIVQGDPEGMSAWDRDEVKPTKDAIIAQEALKHCRLKG